MIISCCDIIIWVDIEVAFVVFSNLNEPSCQLCDKFSFGIVYLYCVIIGYSLSKLLVWI